MQYIDSGGTSIQAMNSIYNTRVDSPIQRMRRGQRAKARGKANTAGKAKTRGEEHGHSKGQKAPNQNDEGQNMRQVLKAVSTDVAAENLKYLPESVCAAKGLTSWNDLRFGNDLGFLFGLRL